MIVTTPWSETEAAEHLALQLSTWFDCDFVPRHSRSIVTLCEEEHAEAIVIADTSPKLVHRVEPARPLYFHPGMAMQRVLGLERGEQDRLLKAAAIQPGDKVVDATLGLGTDSLVLAAGIGPMGHVHSCESSRPLARLFTYAVTRRSAQPPWLAILLGRIGVREQHYLEALKEMSDNSSDVVYFDPMFRLPSSHPSSIDGMRLFADSSPLTDEALAEAVRVARRRVVVKERISSGVFEKFGLQPDKTRTRFSYGILEL